MPIQSLASGARTDGSEGGSEKGDTVLNFDDADIYEVIRTMAALLHINYIVDPNVRGRVTIQTAGAIKPNELFGVFYQILEANGLTAIKEGPLYRITTLKDAARLALPAHHAMDRKALPPGERVVMQIIPLKNIKSEEMTKLLTPFVSSDGTILSDAGSNTLLLVDKSTNIQKALKLVEGFDIDIFEGISYRFYKMNNVPVKDLAPILESAFAPYQGGFRSEVKLIPIERLNMLLVMSHQQQAFEKIAPLLETLDAPSEGTNSQIYIYSVKNAESGDLATLLDSIFSKKAAQATDRRSSEQPQAAAKPESKPQSTLFAVAKETKTDEKLKPAATYTSDLPSATLRGDIRIIPDTTRNLLIIEALPSDWHVIRAVLERLDILARQVLIEAMIAEISLEDSLSLGLEWRYQKGEGQLSTSLLSAATGAGGLQFLIGQTDRWTATLNALASEDKVNILSSPTVLASNEKEARIDISTEIPVASAQFQYGGSTDESVLQTSIEYRNTGIILNVTPYINENGMVTMDISQEVSEQASDVIVGDQIYPSFFKRSVATTLTVGNNQTIVIGGLIRENKSDNLSGVPFLSKIPILGFLFGKNVKSGSKSELIILITPRVIVNLGDVEAVTDEFKTKVQRIWQPS